MSPSRPDPKPPVKGAEPLKISDSWLQPDVWAFGTAPDRRVWKTFRRSPWFLRHTVGRVVTAREARNLRLLEGLPRIPRLLARPHPWTIEMSFLDAEGLPDRGEAGQPAADFFAELERLVAEMHARGLNHGDLRRLNLMRLRGSGEPCLIDFAQSMWSPSPHSLFHRLILRRAFRVDRLKLLKLKKWYLGWEGLTEVERADLAAIPWYLSLGRGLRGNIYSPIMDWFERRQKQRRKQAGK
ncbi:MAG: phosphotransferase [Candidatus Sumerlaeia bacterium]|nr:phosphotransferase [Candidatus Sumerlaeia bacterium]